MGLAITQNYVVSSKKTCPAQVPTIHGLLTHRNVTYYPSLIV